MPRKKIIKYDNLAAQTVRLDIEEEQLTHAFFDFKPFTNAHYFKHELQIEKAENTEGASLLDLAKLKLKLFRELCAAWKDEKGNKFDLAKVDEVEAVAAVSALTTFAYRPRPKKEKGGYNPESSDTFYLQALNNSKPVDLMLKLRRPLINTLFEVERIQKKVIQNGYFQSRNPKSSAELIYEIAAPHIESAENYASAEVPAWHLIPCFMKQIENRLNGVVPSIISAPKFSACR